MIEAKKKLGFEVARWVVLGLLGVIVLSGQTTIQNAKNGEKAYKMAQELQIQVDTNEELIYKNKSEQDITNAVVVEQINGIQKDLDYIIKTLDEIRINMYEGGF